MNLSAGDLPQQDFRTASSGVGPSITSELLVTREQRGSVPGVYLTPS